MENGVLVLIVAILFTTSCILGILERFRKNPRVKKIYNLSGLIGEILINASVLIGKKTIGYTYILLCLLAYNLKALCLKIVGVDIKAHDERRMQKIRQNYTKKHHQQAG